MASTRSDETSVEMGGESVRITSPGKLIFPRQGWTKLDVVKHFLTVAEGALRGIYGRPTMLKRYLENVDVPPVYHKRAEVNTPFETVSIRFPSQRPGVMNVPRTQADVIRLAQRGCLDFHPWPARAEDTDHPDELRIDLDPTPGYDFGHVRRAALAVREVLDEVGLIGWPKTSGSRGIHILVRVRPEWDFYQCRRAVLALARELERRHPDLITTKWWKEERRGVFIDFNQMARDKTVSSAYGVRPTGFVSAPLRWDEVPEVSIEDFPMDRFAERYASVGDLTAGIDEAAGWLEPVLKWIDRDEDQYGQGDAPWPPMYPKVTGEPTRVQPSKKRAVVGKDVGGEIGATFTIEQYLADKGERARGFWNGLVALTRRCGDFEFAAGKTRSGFMLRARFVVVYTLSDRGISFGLSMATRRDHSRFRKIEQVGVHEFFHHVRVDELDQLDHELGDLICLAYQWGQVGAK
ncbi:MAG: non-homologous end-joining DNA ligase LigD [Actinomycetota bacterium]